MNARDPQRDTELARILRDAGLSASVSPARLRALNQRIVGAATPLLDAREARHRTVWDYTERWSSVLLPVGAFAAVAAGLCLFLLSAPRDPVPPRSSGTRVALMGAATNDMSSQNLLDFLVSDPSAPTTRSRR